MLNFIKLITIVSTAITLTGCALPKTKEEVAIDVDDEVSIYCSTCKGYRAHTYVHQSDRNEKGYLGVDAGLMLAKDSNEPVPHIYLGAGLTYNGQFGSSKYWLLNSDSTAVVEKLKIKSEETKCSNNIGTFCWRKDRLVIDPVEFNRLAKAGKGITFVVGLDDSNMRFTFPDFYVQGFIEGVRRKGAQLPDGTAEKAIADRANEARINAEAAIKRKKDLERSEKQKIGTAICKIISDRRGAVRYIGYVENTANGKVQIRLSSAHFVSNPQIGPGDFTQTIIWDDPESWDLCQ